MRIMTMIAPKNINSKTYPEAFKNLPYLESSLYFDYMKDFINILESRLPIRVYGFSGYSTIAYYWKNPEGYDEPNPNTISFRMAYYICYGV